MDDRQLTLLRRKLEALNYTQPLHPASAPLVDSLVSDLVRTTDSYRQLKLQSAQQAQEIAGFNTKLEVVRQESGRLLSENNQLHLELIKQAEKHGRQEKEGYLASKKLEGQVADLSYWKQHNQERLEALDRENAQLKQKLAALVAQFERRSKGARPKGRAMGSMRSRDRGADRRRPPPQTASSPATRRQRSRSPSRWVSASREARARGAWPPSLSDAARAPAQPESPPGRRCSCARRPSSGPRRRPTPGKSALRPGRPAALQARCRPRGEPLTSAHARARLAQDRGAAAPAARVRAAAGRPDAARRRVRGAPREGPPRLPWTCAAAAVLKQRRGSALSHRPSPPPPRLLRPCRPSCAAATRRSRGCTSAWAPAWTSTS
jgi:hypothetical protein